MYEPEESTKTSMPIPVNGWEMVRGGVELRRLLRQARCFISGHESVHVQGNIFQCMRCHKVGN